MQGILVLAHGSRAKETEQTLESIVGMVREKLPEYVIKAAFMEFGSPNIAAGLSALMDMGCTEVAVMPYFLFNGIHIKEDIPQEIAAFTAKHPALNVKLGRTLGTDARLADLLADRIRESI